uniref:Secreted protein n=1 Tax=Glossina palpalis gambiensis TaxID=67801 RepID=A0A1B0AUJ7_9MUSC
MFAVASFVISVFLCWYVFRKCSAIYTTFRGVHNDYEANKSDKKVLCLYVLIKRNKSNGMERKFSLG